MQNTNSHLTKLNIKTHSYFYIIKLLPYVCSSISIALCKLPYTNYTLILYLIIILDALYQLRQYQYNLKNPIKLIQYSSMHIWQIQSKDNKKFSATLAYCFLSQLIWILIFKPCHQNQRLTKFSHIIILPKQYPQNELNPYLIILTNSRYKTIP